MTTFKTSRKISATVEQVFAAFQPERLARWWGPAGLANTFSICEFFHHAWTRRQEFSK
jgi:uncharacterized protein YndB with AHSA1/START domain